MSILTGLTATPPAEILMEDYNGESRMFIKGIFVQANIPNKNKRIYSESVMDKACSKFNEEYVSKNRGVGELNHPDTIAIDLERIAQKIITLDKHGTDYVGKALILNTSKGKELKALAEANVIFGVSSRGYGTTTRKDGYDHVNDDFTIVAIDTVFHPSAPNALVSTIMESQVFDVDRSDKDMIFLESIRHDINKTNRLMLEEAKLRAFSKYVKYFIR